MARTLSLTRHRMAFSRLLTQHRFLMLFLFLLATLIAYPYTEGRFGMMTQLGSSGIAAVTDQARSVSVIEAILGQLYLAVLISRLVGAYRITQPAVDS